MTVFGPSLSALSSQHSPIDLLIHILFSLDFIYLVVTNLLRFMVDGALYIVLSSEKQKLEY